DGPGIPDCSTLCRYRKFRYARAAYFGLLKVGAQSHLKAMCLNLLKAANRLSAPAAA
ncbi:transposase, partial [Neisseria gonorrhoeae]